ncbi:MAG: hypothetical protein VKL39_23090 [Leptolyngbyaceae bacterium]|nr:hypothetical protein [Leptolyngbyaceae bacterium]
MLELIKSTVKPLSLDYTVLEAAYALYLEAPQAVSPVISLKALSKKTGKSMLHCRNTIVEANAMGRFPDCSLQSGSLQSGSR